jgi:hypothetical protein
MARDVEGPQRGRGVPLGLKLVMGSSDRGGGSLTLLFESWGWA